MSAQHVQAKAHSTARKVALCCALVLCLVGVGMGLAYLVGTNLAARYEVSKFETSVEPSTPEALAVPKDSQLPKNPIDFATLQSQNPDVCAWLFVPGTKVNRAVLQHPTDNGYYLTHDETGASVPSGAPFVELYNSPAFDDAVTVVYGHNWTDDVMFTTLHQFQDQEFFDAHDRFYVYTSGHIYTYQIVSAFSADNRHIMATHDFSDPDELQAFQESVAQASGPLAHVRASSLGPDSRLVVLSTCFSGVMSQNNRYLVCGVMVDDVAMQ